MDLSDVVPDALRGGDAVEPAMQWRDRLEQLLFEGETVEERIDLAGDAAVVVTSHRVLAFTPDQEGANFSQVERPNVDGVTTGAVADSDLLGRGLRWGVYGVVMLGAGFLIDLDSLVASVDLSAGGASSRIGLGGIMGLMQTLLDLLAQLDDFLRLFGALFLLLAVAMVGAYLHTRDRTLVVRVAGGEDVHLPRPGDVEGTRERIEAALGFRPSPEVERGQHHDTDPIGER